jgi:predicted amino acid-binding ACT domain protein
VKATRVYVTCDTPDVVPLKEAAQTIALQRGCDPVRVPWPLQVPEESGEEREKYDSELWVCQKQFRRIISECDLFVAIVSEKYGKLRVPPPVEAEGESAGQRISSMHWEILEALNTSGKMPEVMVFKHKVWRAPRVEEMLGKVPELRQTEFDTEMQFKSIFSKKLSEHKEISLSKYLASLKRYRISITCRDQVGLLAGISEVVRKLKGNLAEASQITKGRFAILQFVAEWPVESCPNDHEGGVRKALKAAFKQVQEQSPGENETGPDERPQIEVLSIEGSDSQFNTLLTFMITFVDQPGIASHIFARISDEKQSVFSTQIETFLSGGMMLGRARFSLRGDGFGLGQQTRLAEELKKLPGILHVDSSALRGRFWG